MSNDEFYVYHAVVFVMIYILVRYATSLVLMMRGCLLGV
jgi:hypothetical protein